MKKVGIIGSGAMGSGIAQVFAQAGHSVILYDTNHAALERSKANLAKTFEKLVAKEKYTEEQSAQLSKVAEMYRNVADAEITSATASGFLVSQMKAFNLTTSDSTTILDSLNSISNNYAVSSTDIAEGLSKSSASLSAYGNSMSQTMSLVTAG